MRRDPRAYLADIIEAAGLVTQFTSGLDLEAYRADKMVRSATERQLEIVGEALTKLRRVDPDISARIPDHRRIIGFRNVLVHGYDVVDDEIVWRAATVEAPALVEAASVLLSELDGATTR